MRKEKKKFQRLSVKTPKQPELYDQHCTNCTRNFSPGDCVECNNCYHVTGWNLYPEEVTPLSDNYWNWDGGNPVKNPYE